MIPLRASILAAIAVSASFAAEPKLDFPAQVRQLLSGQWTDMTITTALVTDYGVIIATSIHLKRPDAAKLPTAVAATVGSPDLPLADADWKDLSIAVEQAAKATFEFKYPLEIYHSMPREDAQKLVESGQLKIRATDIEILHIRASTPKGEVILDESGPYDPLDTVIQRLLKTKARELKPFEFKSILGRNPYEGADITNEPTGANKTDAGNGSKAICRVSNVLRSPSPDPKR